MISLLKRSFSKQPSSSPKVSELGRPGLPCPSVIIVEDEPSLQNYLGQLARSAGLSSAAASALHEVEALELGRSSSLVLLDLSLVGCDGIDVLRHLARIGFTGPILLMSGHDAAILSYVHHFGQQQGLTMLDPLKKPFKGDSLKTVLARFGEASALPVQIDFKRVMEDGQLEVWYQPRVHLGSYQAVGIEALVRIRDPQHGVLLPGRFFNQLSDSNMAELSAYVLQRLIRDWQHLADLGFVLKPSMNVRARELISPALIDILKQSRPSDPRWSGLTMELTDAYLADEVETVREAVVRLQLQNVKLALDDFGDLATEKVRCPELKLSEVNIDRRYVNGCAADRQRLAICKAAVLFARRRRLSVVAEGIETAEDLEAMQALGCDMAQGNLFAGAMPLALLQDLLEKGEPLYKRTVLGHAKAQDGNERPSQSSMTVQPA